MTAGYRATEGERQLFSDILSYEQDQYACPIENIIVTERKKKGYQGNGEKMGNGEKKQQPTKQICLILVKIKEERDEGIEDTQCSSSCLVWTAHAFERNVPCDFRSLLFVFNCLLRQQQSCLLVSHVIEALILDPQATR